MYNLSHDLECLYNMLVYYYQSLLIVLLIGLCEIQNNCIFIRPMIEAILCYVRMCHLFGNVTHRRIRDVYPGILIEEVKIPQPLIDTANTAVSCLYHLFLLCIYLNLLSTYILHGLF